jgi:hypothetical protein
MAELHLGLIIGRSSDRVRRIYVDDTRICYIQQLLLNLSVGMQK